MNLPILHLEKFNIDLESIYINTFEQHIHTHKFVNTAHKHDFFLAVLFTEGHGSHEIDFKEYSIEPGAFFIMKPGQYHHWKTDPHTKGFVFLCQTLHLNPYNPLAFNSLLSSAKVSLESADLNFAIQNFSYLLQHSEISKGLKLQVIHTLFSLFTEHSTTQSRLDLLKNTEHLGRLEQALQRFIRKEHQAQFYAVQSAVSEKHLNRICKENLGISLKALIHQRLLLEAKKVLLQALTLDEVAETLGFEDQGYFSKWFKKQTSLSPKDYRKSIQNQASKE